MRLNALGILGKYGRNVIKQCQLEDVAPVACELIQSGGDDLDQPHRTNAVRLQENNLLKWTLFFIISFPWRPVDMSLGACVMIKVTFITF